MRAWYIGTDCQVTKYAMSNEGLTQVSVDLIIRHRHIYYAIMQIAIIKEKKQEIKVIFIGPLKYVEKTKKAPS